MKISRNLNTCLGTTYSGVDNIEYPIYKFEGSVKKQHRDF